MNHKIGIIVMYNEKRYEVLCIEDVPSKYYNSTWNFNKFCEEHQANVKEIATSLCNYYSKENYLC